MAYSVRADLNQVFGVNNVTKWADLDNDEDVTKIANRITTAIVYADDLIDSFMRDGPYPLPLINAIGATPALIVNSSASLAGVWLYEARGVEDSSDAGEHRLKLHEKKAMLVLKDIHSGKLKTGGSSVRNFAPTVVEAT